MLVIGVHQEPREFAAKFVLAHAAARRYGSAAICRTSSLPQIARDNEGLVIVEMALTPNRARMFALYRERGHRILSFDEEASAAASIPESRLHPDAVSNIDGLILWGSHHEELLEGRVSDAKLIRSGHPRLEVAQRENIGLFGREVGVIQRIGPYALWVTDTRNYPFDGAQLAYNDHLVHLRYKSERDAYPYEPKLRSDFVDMYEELQDRLRRQARLLEELRDGHNLKIVIRPRLTVGRRVMQQQLRSVGFDYSDRSIVTNRFAVTPWIASASVVVQHGCTTALESAAAGSPVVSYPPSRTKRLSEVPFRIAPAGESSVDVFKRIQGMDDNCVRERFALVSDYAFLPSKGSSREILDWIDARSHIERVAVLSSSLRVPQRGLRSRLLGGPVADGTRELLGSRLATQRAFRKSIVDAYLEHLNRQSGSRVRLEWRSQDCAQLNGFAR